MTDQTTQFGFERVALKEKTRLVSDVFDSVANRYDLMNDLMSFGAHRIWKRVAVVLSDVRRGGRVLDIAAGTGDLTARLAQAVGSQGWVIGCDPNASMLALGRARLADRGIVGNVSYVQASAERLPFPDNHFDCVTIAFGLRNVTDQAAALQSMFRVLKPGGHVRILEFSVPKIAALRKLYDAYSFHCIPRIGRLVTGDRESYQYLVESIRVHPDQEELAKRMCAAGFERCDYLNMSGGIVALHRGYKF